MVLAWMGAAFAQQTCIEPMSRIQFGAAIGQIDDSLKVSELIEAREQINALIERLPCLDMVVDRELFALFARSNAIVYFYGQDEEQAARWGAASRLAKADLPWDEKLYPPDNPIRTFIDAAPLPEMLVLSGGLAVPKGGGLFINGTFAPRPEGWPNTPTLIQVFDRSQSRVEALWQDGHQLPESLLTGKAEDIPAPSWWTGDAATIAFTPKPDPKTPKPTRPPGERPPLVPIATSVGLGIVSAASYAVALQTASSFRNDPHSSEELTALRTRANLLVLVSGTTLAGAVGVGVGGVLVSANGITVRF